MSVQPEVVPLFATPFGVATLPASSEANAALAALFSARSTPQWRATDAATAAGVFRSRDDLGQWQEPPVRLLLQEMLAGVTAVASSICDLTAEQFAELQQEARAFFTVVGPNGYIPAQNYPNSSWLALYCVAAPAASASRRDSGALRLHEFRPGIMFADAAQGASRMPYRPGHCTWRPVAGQMAVFPATIMHEVALLRADSPLILVTARVRFVGALQPWMPPW